MYLIPHPHALTKPQQHAHGHQDEGPQQGHQEPDSRVPAPALAFHHTLASHGCLTYHQPVTHTQSHSLSHSYKASQNPKPYVSLNVTGNSIVDSFYY